MHKADTKHSFPYPVLDMFTRPSLILNLDHTTRLDYSVRNQDLQWVDGSTLTFEPRVAINVQGKGGGGELTFIGNTAYLLLITASSYSLDPQFQFPRQ